MRKVREETGVKVKTLEDEPVLAPHLHWVWKAFTDLNSRRPIAGMGGYLYFSYVEIEAYCRLKGIMTLNDRERLLRLLDALDRRWMTMHAEQQERDNPSSSSPPPPSHSPPRDAGQGRGPPRREV